MRRRQPLVALRALRRLLADPKRTGEVFVITRALLGDSIERGAARFAATATGRAVAGRPRELLACLVDRDALRALPEGSLGRAYLDFVEANAITAEGLVAASDAANGDYRHLDADQARYARRVRDMHDLWHVVTGYSTQPFGEVCVVAFSYRQTRNLGLGVIALVGALKIAREGGGAGVLGAALQALRHGARAAWLPGEDWEVLLAQPLASVRARLGIRPPTRFQALTGYLGDWVPQPSPGAGLPPGAPAVPSLSR
jgi:ubiquinone biosynthesis protein COQ4